MLNNLLYVTIRTNILHTIREKDTDLLLPYAVMLYDYCERGWISKPEKIELYDLIVYGVKMLIEEKNDNVSRETLERTDK